MNDCALKCIENAYVLERGSGGCRIEDEEKNKKQTKEES